MDHLKNIKAALAQADLVDWEEGLLAYSRYNEVIAGLAMHYGFSPAAAAAAFCELSPSNDYVGNLRSLATLVAIEDLEKKLRPYATPKEGKHEGTDHTAEEAKQ